MICLPNEMIYKIASFLTGNKTIIALGKVFPNLRFKLNGLPYLDYQELHKYKDQFIIENIVITYPEELNDKSLPNTIKVMRLGRHFNQPIDFHLPDNLEKLYLGSYFNHPIDGLLPSNLKKLVVFDKFNHPVDDLPPGLEELNLGIHFNQPIDNLPKNLKVLWLRRNFNQKLDNLPKSLETLHLPCFYSNIITKLPENLKIIKTWSRFKPDYVGEKEIDYIKDYYPNVKIEYHYKNIW